MELAIIPRFILKWLIRDTERQYDANVLFSSMLLIAAAFFLARMGLQLANRIDHVCLIKNYIGMNCPGCGMTRAFAEISVGNFNQALAFNAASVVLVAFFLLQIPIRLFFLLSNSSVLRWRKVTKQLNRVVLACILINWIFNL